MFNFHKTFNPRPEIEQLLFENTQQPEPDSRVSLELRKARVEPYHVHTSFKAVWRIFFRCTSTPTPHSLTVLAHSLTPALSWGRR